MTKKNYLSSEDELLLLASKNYHLTDFEYLELHHAVAKITNWDYFLKRAFETNLAPLIKNSFTALKDLAVPTQIIQSLKSYQQKIILHNMQLYSVLEEVGLALNNAGIDFIPLKGMMLAEKIYGNIGLRQISDIDLLIKQTQLQFSKELLIRMGWNCSALVTKHGDDNTINFAHPYTLKKGIATIELHRHIDNRWVTYDVNIDEYWNRATSAPFLKGTACFLLPADLLQHLCLHAYKHLLNQIKIASFVDFREVIAYYDELMDWSQLRVNSLRYGCLKEVQGILALAKAYWDAKVPEHFLADYSEDEFFKIEKMFKLRLVESHGKVPLEAFAYKNLKDELLEKTFYERFMDLSVNFFPSKKYIVYRFAIQNTSLVYFYYPYRWFLGLVRIGAFYWSKLRIGFAGK